MAGYIMRSRTWRPAKLSNTSKCNKSEEVLSFILTFFAISDSDLSTTIFHKTPPISTYLVAFVISNFGNISETYQGVTHRLFTPPTAKYKGEYQLRLAGRTTATIESYLGVEYPLRKMDHVALNKNYGAAMENWGLITYKEDCLLYSPDNVRLGVKAPLTIVHEIAHQWFGNLVSPEWWSYIWLNEGFATYFSYVVIDLVSRFLKCNQTNEYNIIFTYFSYNLSSRQWITFWLKAIKLMITINLQPIDIP